MIDPTWPLYSEEKRRDLLREAEQSRRLKALRSVAPDRCRQRLVPDCGVVKRIWKHAAGRNFGSLKRDTPP